VKTQKDVGDVLTAVASLASVEVNKHVMGSREVLQVLIAALGPCKKEARWVWQILGTLLELTVSPEMVALCDAASLREKLRVVREEQSTADVLERVDTLLARLEPSNFTLPRILAQRYSFLPFFPFPLPLSTYSIYPTQPFDTHSTMQILCNQLLPSASSSCI
jgi:hypothetical protein